MSDGYNYNKTSNSDRLSAELMIRLTALENLLIEKQIITGDELKEQYTILAHRILNIINTGDELLQPPSAKMLAAHDQEAEFNELLKELNINPYKISKGN